MLIIIVIMKSYFFFTIIYLHIWINFFHYYYNNSPLDHIVIKSLSLFLYYSYNLAYHYHLILTIFSNIFYVYIACHKVVSYLYRSICSAQGYEVPKYWFEDLLHAVTNIGNALIIWNMAINTDRTTTANQPTGLNSLR